MVWFCPSPSHSASPSLKENGSFHQRGGHRNENHTLGFRVCKTTRRRNHLWDVVRLWLLNPKPKPQKLHHLVIVPVLVATKRQCCNLSQSPTTVLLRTTRTKCQQELKDVKCKTTRGCNLWLIDQLRYLWDVKEDNTGADTYDTSYGRRSTSPDTMTER